MHAGSSPSLNPLRRGLDQVGGVNATAMSNTALGLEHAGFDLVQPDLS